MKKRIVLICAGVLILAGAASLPFVFAHAKKASVLRLKEIVPAAVQPPQITPADDAKPSKVLYLTFDADMTASMENKLKTGQVKIWYNPAIISYLDEQRIPATIFSTGMFAETYPDLIRKLGSDKNFSVQNHSYSHPGFEKPCYGLQTISSDSDKIDQVMHTQRILSGLAGYAPQYFRFPGLCRNNHDIALVQGLGLQVSDGDIISADAFSSNTAKISENILKHAHDGGVVLMHLGGPHSPVALQVLQNVLPKLRSSGYSFELLPDIIHS